MGVADTEWSCHPTFKRYLSDCFRASCKKGPTVLGAQASSPAHVQRNQLNQWLLLRWDTGRRGRLRSQDRGAFLQEAI